MKTIIIISLIQTAFLFLLVITKKNRKQSHISLLSWFLVMFLVQLFFLLLFYFPNRTPISALLALSVFPLISGPVYLFFVSSITGENILQKYFHLAPFIVLLLTLFYLYWGQDANIIIRNGFLFADRYSTLFEAFGYLLAISPLVYILWSFAFYKRFKKALKDNYSNNDHLDLNWLRIWILAASAFFILSFLAVFLATKYSLYNPVFGFKAVAAFNTIYIFVVGYFGLRQTNFFHDLDLINTGNKYQKSGLSLDKAKDLIYQLSMQMGQKELFLDADLKAFELADELGISVNHLSQLLNQHLGKSFYQYVNDLRIEEVKKRLADDKYSHLSNLGIATDCGFKSRSTFSKAFKNNTGISPSDYRKMNRPTR